MLLLQNDNITTSLEEDTLLSNCDRLKRQRVEKRMFWWFKHHVSVLYCVRRGDLSTAEQKSV